MCVPLSAACISSCVRAKGAEKVTKERQGQRETERERVDGVCRNGRNDSEKDKENRSRVTH